MNLITIDNKKLWVKNKKNLLLGNWCINNDHKYKTNNKKNYSISDYHWKNKSKYRKDLKYLCKIYNLLLNNLQLNLNKFHKLNYPKRYWEILLYRWLWLYLFKIYDRWEIVRTTKKNNNKLTSRIFFYDKIKFIANDSKEFSTSILNSDDWNHWIYGEIFKFVGGIDYKFVNKKKIQPKFIYKSGEYESINYLVNSISISSSAKKIYLQDTYFSKKFQVLYNLFNAQYKYSQEISAKELNISTNIAARYNFIKLSKIKDKFAKFAHTLIKYQLPKIYLENYKKTKELIKKSKLLQNPKIIITSTGNQYNDAFKIYAAQKILNGSKLFVIQHGATYGVADFSPDEKLEIKITDKYLTWGWKENDNKTLPFFLQKTAYKKIIKKKSASGLVLPINEFYLSPIQPLYKGVPGNKMDVNKYIENIVLFANHINKNILDVSSFKYLGGIKCKYVLKSLKFKFPNLKFISTSKDTSSISRSFKLTVETINSTGFLESINLNIPTILIFDKQYCSLRRSAIKEFEMLKKVKIIHNSPQEAAKFVNENYNDLEKWWNSNLLQKVKNKFCYKFARRSISPLKDLKKILSYSNVRN